MAILWLQAYNETSREEKYVIYSSMQLNLPLFLHWKISDLRRKKRPSLKKLKSFANNETFVQFDF